MSEADISSAKHLLIHLDSLRKMKNRLISTSSDYIRNQESMEAVQKLEFYKGKISVIKGWLNDLISNHYSKEIISTAKRYENKMNIQNDQICMIRNEISPKEFILQKEEYKNPLRMDHKKVIYKNREKELVDDFESAFNVLRVEIRTFVGQHL
jgi:hypothetical protein